jgi:alpha-ketoglutarate-dependent taurine dioxygenase
MISTRLIDSKTELEAAFLLEPMKPFGLRLTPLGSAGMGDIDPAFLDELARREKLVLLRGLAPIGRAEFLDACRSFPRTVLEWDFGPVMEMKEQPGAKNYLFSREKVPFHWDGAFHKVPTYLMFCCVEAPLAGAGGETLFCDTQKVWAEASLEEHSLWSAIELAYETKKLAHYGGSITGPLVSRHPSTGRTVLRFAEPVETALNPVTLKVSGVSDKQAAAFLRTIRSRIYSPEYCYSHVWRQGDVLIADNHALIHGRNAFALDCPRHLRRIQLV